MKTQIPYFLFLALFIGCNDDKVVIEEPVELITTLNLQLVPQGGGTTITLSFKDLDGDGGNPPIVTSGTLQANTIYDGSLELLNESEAPAVDITAEILDEQEDHQFFFEVNSLNMTVEYDDLDANSYPVGLQTVVKTSGASSGSLKITLRHEPIKDAENVSLGEILNAGGETDIEVEFTVTIEP